VRCGRWARSGGVWQTLSGGERSGEQAERLELDKRLGIEWQASTFDWNRLMATYALERFRHAVELETIYVPSAWLRCGGTSAARNALGAADKRWSGVCRVMRRRMSVVCCRQRLRGVCDDDGNCGRRGPAGKPDSMALSSFRAGNGSRCDVA